MVDFGIVVRWESGYWGAGDWQFGIRGVRIFSLRDLENKWKIKKKVRDTQKLSEKVSHKKPPYRARFFYGDLEDGLILSVLCQSHYHHFE